MATNYSRVNSSSRKRMPYTKKAYTKTSKYARKAQTDYYVPAKNVSAAGDKKNVVLPYHESIVRTGITAGSRSNGFFSASDYALIGNGFASSGNGFANPMGRSQYASLYDQVYVKGVEVDVTVVGVTSTSQIVVNMWADDNSDHSATAATSSQRAVAMGGVHKFQIANTTSNTQPICQFKFKAYTKKVLGFGFSESETNMTLASTSTPEKRMYIHFEIWNVSSSATADVYIDTVVRFDSLFHNPQELSAA